MEPQARLIAKELQVATSSRRRTLYFHGKSMHPFLVEGDEVVVEPVTWDEIAIGDIITYRYLDRFPTRRVVRKTGTGLLLWCENWPWLSFPAAREDILGRAVARRRGDEWLEESDLAWRKARWKARLKYLRYQKLLPLNWRLRDAASKLVRRIGLRRAHRPE
jgi:hypothetical protein